MWYSCSQPHQCECQTPHVPAARTFLSFSQSFQCSFFMVLMVSPSSSRVFSLLLFRGFFLLNERLFFLLRLLPLVDPDSTCEMMKESRWNVLHVVSEANKHDLKVSTNEQTEHQVDVTSSDGCQISSVSGMNRVLECNYHQLSAYMRSLSWQTRPDELKETRSG